jgi:hypothetical protein
MLWFYDPQSRLFKSTSSRERFQNTNASNSDFTRSTLATDYRVDSGRDVKLGNYHCRLLTLSAANTEVQYPKMQVWIDESGLARKTEDFSLSGQRLRTTVFPEYYKIGKRYVPKKILIVDDLRGAVVAGKMQNEKTLITVAKPSFKAVDNAMFSKAFLENINQGGRL